MDKYINYKNISPSNFSNNYDDWILIKYNNINCPSCNCDENNKINKILIKYNKEEIKSENNNKNKIKKETNKRDKIISICDKCINLFSNLKIIYTNIDGIINNILNNDPILYKINDELKNFLNLENNIVHKYNNNVLSNNVNNNNVKYYNEIYNTLDIIGQYHYKYDEYKIQLIELFKKYNRVVNIDEIICKINESLAKFNICGDCQSCLKMCRDCFYKNNTNIIGLNNEQMMALWKLYINIFDDNNLMCGLFGSAGTGKTTLLKYILQILNLSELFFIKNIQNLFLITIRNNINLKDNISLKINEILIKHNQDKKFISILLDIIYSNPIIILASPTNKALDIIREKISEIKNFILSDNFSGEFNNIDIKFFTISKLLTYRKSLDNNHKMIFKRSDDFLNIMNKYNLIIIDEASMINKNNINDITSDINKRNIINKYSKGYILFMGDKAQLPPPKEKYSSVFKLNMDNIELKIIMRTDIIKIKNLCNLIRSWVTKDISNIRSKLLLSKCEYINFYFNKKKFINEFSKKNDSIILVWTNDTRMKYNKIIREKLFKDVDNRYMINEHLIFNNFYKLKKGSFEKIFYSSMCIIISEINVINNFNCKKFDSEIIMDKMNENIKKSICPPELIKPDKYIYDYINEFVYKFNNSMIFNFKIWELYFSYKNVPFQFPINIIYNKKDYFKIIENGKKYIKDYFDATSKLELESKEIFRNIIINIFDEYFEQPFADVDYGYAMTVDKSQGSTYESVFIDSPDILDQDKYPFLDIDTAKRRFYTGISRSSHELNILI